ncbi:hypothetical protein BJ944DRAFT_238087 [Cunninghamella echinulata]|nr:hypothetical protein BJ944DRAFT_238087 [Cunninghamella echinulata]
MSIEDKRTNQLNAHIWKGKDGKFETEATFISLFQGNKIKLRKATGGVIAIPIQRLCDSDLEYLKQQVGLKEWNSLFPDSEKDNSTIIPTSRNNSALSSNTNTNTNTSTLHDLNRAMSNLSTNITSPNTPSPPLPTLKISKQYNNNNNNNNNSISPPPSSPYYPSNNNYNSHHQYHPHISNNHSYNHSYNNNHNNNHNNHNNNFLTSPIQQQQQSPMYHASYSPSPMHHLQQYHPVLSQPQPSQMDFSPTTTHHYYDFSSYHDQHQQRQQRRRSITDLPNQVIINIGYFLDVKSRIRLLRTSKYIRNLILHYDVWHYIDFLKTEASAIEDSFIHQFLNTLRESQLHYSPKIVILDYTLIQATTVSFILQFFPAIRILSIKHCRNMDYHQLATGLQTLSTSSPKGNAICQPNLMQFSMLSKRTITPIHGSDIDIIQHSLNKLAKKSVLLDCQTCDQCKIAACTPTLTCVSCGTVPIKRCLACAPSCDHCQGRVCGGDHCQRNPNINFHVSDCGRCQLPLALCNQPHCLSTIITSSKTNAVKMRQRKPCHTEWQQQQQQQQSSNTNKNNPSQHQHGYFHATCKMKTKLVSNQCTQCGIVACPFCELIKCGGGCHGQWCSSCQSSIDFKHCKCILIQGVVGTKISKRTVCHQCQLACKYCDGHGSSSNITYCYRCLDLHQKECDFKVKLEKKKKKFDQLQKQCEKELLKKQKEKKKQNQGSSSFLYEPSTESLDIPYSPFSIPDKRNGKK